ncbi:MAG: glutamate--tRNA ligase [Planctomycetes bacterium]|nr:glutamate--tRNA ligase [Planctomycetota bacterium]
MSESKSSIVRTRFAPSPSGPLHVGGARTALLCWAYAKAHGGSFILRIEDTDQKRSSDAACRALMQDLHWLGIEWDEGPEYDGCGGGEHGPYFASQRLDLYHRYIDILLEQGKAYRAFEGPEQLEAARATARAEKRVYRYDRAALKLDGATIQRYLDEGRPHVVRFKLPNDEPIVVRDEVRGEVTVDPKEMDDFVILKADGYPTYHLAVVIDDELMDVTHVIRGQEHLYNTPKHVLLQDALGFRRPVFAHLSLILNPDGSKMSKREKAKVARRAAKEYLKAKSVEERKAWIAELVSLDKKPKSLLTGIEAKHKHRFQDVDHNFSAREFQSFLEGDTDEPAIAHLIEDKLGIDLPEVDVQDFRLSGYLPEVLINYLALLGWSPGHDIEKFDRDFLVTHFDLDRVIKSNAKFDRAKLLAFNLDAIQAMSPNQFRELSYAHYREYHPEFVEKLSADQFDMLALSPEQFDMLAAANHSRSKTLDDTVKSSQFFIMSHDAIEYEETKGVRKALCNGDPSGYDHLAAIKPMLADLTAWTKDAIEHALNNYAQEHADGKLGKVAQPLRIAVSGTTVSPAIFETLAILGRDAVLNRIERCLSNRKLSSST